MNQKLIEILPKKITIHDSSALYLPIVDLKYNQAIDDCISALEKHEVGVVPSQKTIEDKIYSDLLTYHHAEDIDPDDVIRLAKAIRSLMFGKGE